MRAAYEAAGEEGGSSAKLHDYSLKEGQTLKLNFSLVGRQGLMTASDPLFSAFSLPLTQSSAP